MAVNGLSTKVISKGIEYNTNCSVGGDENHFIQKLREAFKNAKKVDIIVAFLMESGVKLLQDDIKEAVKNNCKIRILTGNYLGITEPSALYLMKGILGDDADLRFYNDSKRSFHPKAYIFHYNDGNSDIFIGSSNVSKSALTSGIEWNYRLSKSQNEEDFDYFYKKFEYLFLNESIILNDAELKKYSKKWIKPKIKNFSSDEMCENTKDKVVGMFSPREAQHEALAELKRLREYGHDKGIVIAATGIGKTYLSAFDSKEFNTVLFVAHREEILKQAEESFKNVRKDSTTGFFMGSIRDTNKDIIFASVQTLGKEKYLNENYFRRDYFDYIVIDEFHHSVANNYQNIINYFKPKFLLGITATPERMDNKDVFACCDNNVAYEIRLAEAINKGYLSPFRYYGVHDETIDYDKIDKINGKYNEKQLEKALMLEKRADLILNHYNNYVSNEALGFCSSKNHAEYMAKYFTEHGVKACAVYSNKENSEYHIERAEAIEKLKKGEIKVIFSIDMFNEGVDIKSLDMIMFLRPTESPTIFLQQLGRGLRKSKDKEYVNVLDFIGNYKKALLIPELIGGSRKGGNEINPNTFNYPEDCIVNFDFELVNLYKKLERESLNLKDKVLKFFLDVMEEVNKVPSRVELIQSVEDRLYKDIRNNKKYNFFKDYLGFLNKEDKLNLEEKELIETKAHDFIKLIENTAMSKTYKMPILLAFYNNGDMKLEIDEDDIYNSMKSFYSINSNGIDLLDSNNTKDYKTWDKNKYISKAKEMPLKYLEKSGCGFFKSDGNKFKLSNELKPYLNNESFKNHVKDAIDMRVIEYYRNRNIKYNEGN